MNRAQFYADGLRWLGGLINGAADHFERAAVTAANADPRWKAHVDEYLDDVRTRAQLWN